MNCPDTESLIAFALNPLAAENDEIAEHVHGCPCCRLNLSLINDSILADEWASPKAEVRVGKTLRPGEKTDGRVSCDVDRYIRVLDRDKKDMGGTRLRKGTKVLFDPADPYLIKEATEENIRRFVFNGGGFRRRLPQETEAALKAAQTEINRFGPAIDRNMSATRGLTIPGLNLPGWVNLLPWPFRVVFRTHQELAVEREAFVEYLSKKGYLPVLETMTEPSRKALADANFLRAYDLTSGSIRFRVFAVYVTPVNPLDLKAMPTDIGLYRVIKEYIHDAFTEKVNCKCHILGSTSGWNDVPPAVLKDGVEVLCSPDSSRENCWMVVHQPMDSFRRVFRDFVYALYPETVESRISRVREVVDGGLVEGSITSDKVSRITGLPVELVERAFDDLQGEGQTGYRNYVTENGLNAIRRAKGEGDCIYFQQGKVPMWQWAKLIFLAVSVLGEYARQYVSSGTLKLGMLAVCVAIIVITYVQSCFEGFFKRQLEK